MLNDTIEIANANSEKLHLFPSSKRLFDAISKGSSTNEKRVMLDVYAARQELNELDISNIVFVRSSHSIADKLTNSMSKEALGDIIGTEKLSIDVEQMIICKPNEHLL